MWDASMQQSSPFSLPVCLFPIPPSLSLSLLSPSLSLTRIAASMRRRD